MAGITTADVRYTVADDESGYLVGPVIPDRDTWHVFTPGTMTDPPAYVGTVDSNRNGTGTWKVTDASGAVVSAACAGPHDGARILAASGPCRGCGETVRNDGGVIVGADGAPHTCPDDETPAPVATRYVYVGKLAGTADHVPASPDFRERACRAVARGAIGDCVRVAGHDGPHQGAHFDAWVDVPVTDDTADDGRALDPANGCYAIGPGDVHACTRVSGHDGPHIAHNPTRAVNAWAAPTPCPVVFPFGIDGDGTCPACGRAVHFHAGADPSDMWKGVEYGVTFSPFGVMGLPKFGDIADAVAYIAGGIRAGNDPMRYGIVSRTFVPRLELTDWQPVPDSAWPVADADGRD